MLAVVIFGEFSFLKVDGLNFNSTRLFDVILNIQKYI